MKTQNTAVFLFMVFAFKVCMSNPDGKRLYDKLLKTGYNKLIRPVGNNSDKLTVRLGLRLSQLIDVDEKNQIMTTNVWLRHEWTDYKLKWDPKEYGGVNRLYVPSTEIWLPDIVLYNNADGNYEVTLMTKATLFYSGKVVWEPPAIYKSSCPIDVEFFPFDEQVCHMKFGSWTYDGFQVDLKHINQSDASIIENGINMTEFYQSVEWDILSVPAERREKRYTCCEEPYPDLTFNITMKRKTLFYTVNLIIPCVAISFLTVLVFYLPSDSGEKIALCISILLSLTVFILLLADIIPPTSLVVPLIGKYLLFTMILVTLSIIVTVIVLNVHFRSPSTHTMAPWVRRVFLNILPRLLLMRRPNIETEMSPQATPQKTCNGRGGSRADGTTTTTDTNSEDARTPFLLNNSGVKDDVLDADANYHRRIMFSPEVRNAIEGVNFIAQHLKLEDEDTRIQEDWKYVAMVLDRLFLWVFTTACIVGTFGIILQAPTLYGHHKPIA